MITISSSHIVSTGYDSMPSGLLKAYGDVISGQSGTDFDPVTVTNIMVLNENGWSFFASEKLSVSALRAIAAGLVELADEAEEAHRKLAAFNAFKS